MSFIKIAVTQYESDRATPAIGADDIWINIDQIVSIEEHLGSNSFDAAVRAGRTAVEHYPCLQLTMSTGHTHLVPLGSYPDQASGLAAIARFLPTITDPTRSPREELLELLG